MTVQLASALFLVMALALSWSRFVSIFSANAGPAPLTTIASTVSLAALGIAFASGPWSGAGIASAGVLLGTAVRIPLPSAGIILSAISLAAHLRISPIGT